MKLGRIVVVQKIFLWHGTILRYTYVSDAISSFKLWSGSHAVHGSRLQSMPEGYRVTILRNQRFKINKSCYNTAPFISQAFAYFFWYYYLSASVSLTGGHNDVISLVVLYTINWMSPFKLFAKKICIHSLHSLTCSSVWIWTAQLYYTKTLYKYCLVPLTIVTLLIRQNLLWEGSIVS